MTAFLTPCPRRSCVSTLALGAAGFLFSDLVAQLNLVSSAAMADMWSKLFFFFFTVIKSLLSA